MENKIFFSFEKYQKSAPSIVIVVIFFLKVPLSVPSLLFLQSIRIGIVATVGTFKVPSAHLCL